MNRTLTCIVCPMGCTLNVETENNVVKSVSGNTCPRGENYAKKECVSPERNVTSTMIAQNGTVVPVKTSCPIPKDKVFECMKIINVSKITLPVKAGDVIIENVFGSNIVASRTFEK